MYLFAIENNNTNYVVLMKIKPSAPPRYEIIKNISIPSRVSAVALDSLLDPLSVAIGFANKVLIIDLAQNTTTFFAVLGNIHKIYPYGPRAYIVLTDKGVFAIRSYKDTWFEARPVIGTLLEKKREGVKIDDIIPVLISRNSSLEYTYLLVAKEEVAPAATIQVPIEVLWANGSLVNSGLLYLVVSHTLVSEATITNGSTMIAIPKSQPKLMFYAKIDKRCYGPIVVPLDQLISQNISKPLLIEPNMTVPCQLLTMFSKQNYLAILSPEGNLTLKEYPLQRTTTNTLGNINVLLAYMDSDRIYLWISGSRSKVFTTEDFIAILVFARKDFSPLIQLWRYYAGIKATYVAVSTDTKLVAIGTSSGDIYIAEKTENGSYALKWSLPLLSQIRTISLVKARNEYILSGSDSKGNVALAVITGDKPPRIYTISTNNEPFVYFNGLQAFFIEKSFNNTLYAVIPTVKGLTVLTNVNKVIDKGVTIKSFNDFIVGTARITVINEDNEPIKGFKAITKILLGNTTVLQREVVSETNIADVPCFKYAFTQVIIEPFEKEKYENIVKTINCSSTSITYDDIIIKIPYKKYNVSLSIRDSYTKAPPLVDLEVYVHDIKRNKTYVYHYPANVSVISLKHLIPGNYTIRVLDPSGILYRESATSALIPQELNISIEVNRRPITTIVRLSPSQDVKKALVDTTNLDILLVKVYGKNGEKLFEYHVKAPLQPTDISFTTLYRGDAIIEIIDLPPTGYGKLFADIKYNVHIPLDKPTTMITVRLVPMKHPVSIETYSEGEKPVKTLIKIYYVNATKPVITSESMNGKISIELIKGKYCLEAIPLEEYLGFKLYMTNKTCFEVKGIDRENISILVKRGRKISNIIIVDSISKGGKIIDNITVVLDGKEVASLAKGKVHRLALPILINGSTISIKSANNVYKNLEKKVKPQKKDIVLKLVRNSYKYTLVIMSTEGEKITGATVTITGIDNILNLKYVSDENGQVSINIPYGTYKVCASSPGYYLKCLVSTIHASASYIVKLKPTPATLIKKYIIPITIAIVGAILIVAVRMYFKRVLERLSTEEF
ncbi:hypothetical protein PYJP_10260 [Pyrofollis japonicus]|nr:hypothetical protein PYJP_10260 [Pyrofollis japonicus]